MKIRPEHLSKALDKALAPVYLLAGEEPLLVQECRDQVIRAAHRQDFLERKIYEIDQRYDWASIGAEAAERSLFSSRRIVDIRLPTGKPGVDGGKFLSAWAADPDPDSLLIVSCTAWDASSRQSAWAAKLAAAGVQVEIWPVKPAELPGWIAARLTAAGLSADREAIALLANLVEGNLLVASQEIEKLRLANSGGRISAEIISRSVANGARFDAFQLGINLFSGDARACLRVTSGLRRNDMAIQALTGALYYQLSQLEAVYSAVRAGEREDQACRRHRVFATTQPSMHQALRRLDAERIDRSFQFLNLADRQSKGQAAGDPWHTLDHMMLDLCGTGGGGATVPQGSAR